MKSHVPEEHKKDIAIKLACGSVAGLLGQTFTYPLDVVRRQMQVIYFLTSPNVRKCFFVFCVNVVRGLLQVQRLSASDIQSVRGTIDTLVMLAKTDGWKHLFSGLSLNYLKVKTVGNT